jgi:hypothetical protein
MIEATKNMYKIFLTKMNGCPQINNGSEDMSRFPLSVRNVVPTLTSNKRQGLSLNGRC